MNDNPNEHSLSGQPPPAVPTGADSIVAKPALPPGIGAWSTFWPSGSVGTSFAWFLGLLAVISIVFVRPLIETFGFALRSDLNSHILLIPFVVIYLVRLQRYNLVGLERPALFVGGSLIAAGLVGALVTWFNLSESAYPKRNDYLSGEIFFYVLCVIGAGFLYFGTGVMRVLAFPAAFLFFLTPLPNTLTHWIEVFFQHTSAEAANAFLSLSGTPYVHEGLLFHLPGISIRVAEECSGIRSSLILFITSLLAGHLFLVTRWKKTVLALAVIPLGILRNGFRISTIAVLCVRIDPRMIDSPIHHRGGPIFFVLSLVPFFLLLHYLRNSEPEYPNSMRKEKVN